MGPEELTGLVLAGGRSRRMGTEKALLLLDGERLVDRAVRTLGECCSEVLVASGDGERLEVDAAQVADAEPDAGPLAGLVAGLAAARTPLLAVVAVDAPFVDVPVLQRCQQRVGAAAACAPRVDGVLQPLHAVWSVTALPAARASLQEGAGSPRRLLGRLATVVLEPADWAAVSATGGRFALSWNRPDDLPRGLPGASRG